MSKFYIIATNKELKTNNKTFNYKKFNIDCLRPFNEGFLNEKHHYIINFSTSTEIGYNIKNYHDFQTDSDKIFFMEFLKEIDELLNCGHEIILYQFWDTSQSLDINENLIYQSKEISTNPEDFMEDYFSFEFNTKYVFVQNLTLNN